MRNVVESRWLSGKKLIIGLVGLIVILSLSPAQQERNPHQELYDKLLKPTVKISTATGTGSGVIIATTDYTDGTDNTYILTASHVVGNYSSVSVTFYSYRRGAEVAEELKASVVITDTRKDLALLSVLSVSAVNPAKLAPRNYKPYLFTPVWVIGCSLGLNPRPSFGHLSALGDSVAKYWEVSAPILPGNSGGPVYDANTHELIGIAVWVHTYHGQLMTTMAGIVPVQQIYEFLEDTPLNPLLIEGTCLGKNPLLRGVGVCNKRR